VLVGPVDSEGVAADELGGDRGEGAFGDVLVGEDGEAGLGLGGLFFAEGLAARAGALGAEVADGVSAGTSVLPVDFELLVLFEVELEGGDARVHAADCMRAAVSPEGARRR
jgi:hypothetical protein